MPSFGVELTSQLATFPGSGSVSGDEPFEVVARIWGAGWIQFLREAPPDLNEFNSEVEEGGESMLVRFKANKVEGPIRWFLPFGYCAEVLQPQSLRDRMREELEEALKLYHR